MDPEDVKVFADQCARRMSATLRQFGGTVLRVLGDEVLAVFGAPVAHEDDAERAVRAALTIRDMEISGDPERPVQVHVGVNTGQVMAGLMGPDENRDYTVMGDVVNTAARLRSAAPTGSILVGAETYQTTQIGIRYRAIVPIEAKGKDQPVRAWEALEIANMPKARPQGTAPLIGRGGELERLEAMWRRVERDHQPHLVTIVGEPGIGKSRLVAELLRLLPASVQNWQARCLPYGETLGYSPLAGMFKEAAQVLATDSAEQARARLDELVASLPGIRDEAPEMAWHLALLSSLDTPGDRQVQGLAVMPDQRALHASARRFVEAYARQTPLCLIVDDIQWADDTLLDLLESMASRIREAALLIITMARPELDDKRPAWGRGVRSFAALTLEPLEETLERELIAALGQERGLPADVIQKIGRGAGGNPLFAEEIVAMIAERGLDAGVPSVIKMLIAARLDALPPAERRPIQLAAVLGKGFWAGGLQALEPSVGAGSVLVALLEALEEKDLVRPVPRSQLPGEREFILKHDLIRDVAYDMLPRAERRRLHGRAAEWLEAAAGEQVESFLDQLAHHAVEAGQQERAIGYLQRAAARASRAASHRMAAALLSQAIGLAEAAHKTPLMAQLRAQRGKALASVGLWNEAQPDLEFALGGLLPGQLEERVDVLLDLARTKLWALDVDGLRAHSNEAIRLATQVGRNDLAAAAIAHLSEAESLEGNVERGVALYEEALSHAGQGPIPYLSGISTLGLNLYWLGRYAESIPRAQEAIDLARGDTSATIESLPPLGLAYAARGQYTTAEQVFAEARRFGNEFETWPLLARSIAMSAGWHLSVFDLSGHAVLAQEARDLARSVNFVPPLVSASIDLVLNYARQGEVAQAERLWPDIEQAVERAGSWHRWLWRMRVAQARAEVALARGAWEHALSLAQVALDVSQAHGRVKYVVLALEAKAKALTQLGQRQEAINALRRAVAVTRPTGDSAALVRAGAALLALDGNDALAQETRQAFDSTLAALPNEAMRLSFQASEQAILITKLA